MLSRRSLSTLSSAERQLLRRQWLSSGQCIRCFHASLRRDAGEGGSGQQNQGDGNGNDRGTPYNQPQRGPTRHQRAAQISEEVRLLNRETQPGPSKPPNDGADFAVGPQGTGELATPGRMGENMSPGREGPMAQGASGYVRPQDDIEADAGTQQIRGTRMPSQGVEDPTHGGARLMEGDATPQFAIVAGRAARPEEDEEGEEEEQEDDDDDGVPEQPDLVTHVAPARRGPTIPAPGVPYQPQAPTLEALIHSSTNASTIAGANFEGVIIDRLRLIADPGQDPTAGTRDINALAHKLITGQIVRFSSDKEKAHVLATVRELKGISMAKNIRDMVVKYANTTQPYLKVAGKHLDNVPCFACGDRGHERNTCPNRDHKLTEKQRDELVDETVQLAADAFAKHRAEIGWKRRDSSMFRDDQWFQPLKYAGVARTLVEKMMNGAYDKEGFLKGGQKHKQPVLNGIAKMGLKNGTYLPKDSERFLKKVQSLLPAATAQRAPQQAARARPAAGGAAPSAGQSKPRQQQARQ